jgi:hypothetical protein
VWEASKEGFDRTQIEWEEKARRLIKEKFL